MSNTVTWHAGYRDVQSRARAPEPPWGGDRDRDRDRDGLRIGVGLLALGGLNGSCKQA